MIEYCGRRLLLRGRCSSSVSFCVAGAQVQLVAPPERSAEVRRRLCFAWQVQHLEHPSFILRGMCGLEGLSLILRGRCSPRVAASGHKWPPQAVPIEWPQVAASGCKWPLQTVPSKWPQVAASGRSRHFQASGRKWPEVAASGRKWPLQTVPSEWPQVAAFGQINFHRQSNLSARLFRPCDLS